MTSVNQGYYRYPTIHGNKIAFVCEDSLWLAVLDHGPARRLTEWPGEIVFPHFSPDGRWIAFSATKEGTANVYCIPAEGGEVRRLTYHNVPTVVTGWTPDSRSVLFRSPMASPTRARAAVAAPKGSHTCRTTRGRVLPSRSAFTPGVREASSS